MSNFRFNEEFLLSVFEYKFTYGVFLKYSVHSIYMRRPHYTETFQTGNTLNYSHQSFWDLFNFMVGLHTDCSSIFMTVLRTCHTPGCEYCKDSSLSLIYCTNSFLTRYNVLQRAETCSGSQTVGRTPSLILFHF